MRRHDGPDDWREANRARWDERVAIHTASDYYDQDRFRRARDVIRDFEVAEVGDVTGRSLLHLQCHFGQDTLSWAHRGAARVVGLDFSEPAIETARELAAELGYGPDRAAFVAADVYDAAEAVPDDAYDIVYTGIGALNWLPDLERWADTAASLVAPGGLPLPRRVPPAVRRPGRRDRIAHRPRLLQPGRLGRRSLRHVHGLGGADGQQPQRRMAAPAR